MARTALATRAQVEFARQRLLGRDLHFRLTPPNQPVRHDDGRYRAGLTGGLSDRRPLFTGPDGAKVAWADGSTEGVEAVILATGYRLDLPTSPGWTGPRRRRPPPSPRRGLPRPRRGGAAAAATPCAPPAARRPDGRPARD
ncbi:hypothetical protein [Streptomyces sp. NPDC005533]|uniref:hypothetical protein n=1 Tax=Streptomyces sp. NPDC005533 TaxID=3364723 RepID=UPI00367C3CF6